MKSNSIDNKINNNNNNNSCSNANNTNLIRMINANKVEENSIKSTPEFGNTMTTNSSSSSSSNASFNSFSLNSTRTANSLISNQPTKSLNFTSNNSANRSLFNNKDIFANSYNFPSNSAKDSITLSALKFRRTSSTTNFLIPSVDSILSHHHTLNSNPTVGNLHFNSGNNNLNSPGMSLIATIGPTSITGTFNSLPSFASPGMLRSKFKSNFSPFHTKRHKAANLTMIDYCNIINLNTSFQMLNNYCQENIDDSMSRLTLKTIHRNGITLHQHQQQQHQQKQASIAEQMAILFGSTMCTCYLCKMKIVKNAKRNQRHHFEISPNKNNMDYAVVRYTYSSPYSQLSTLKLFNIINTDCSIYFNTEANMSTNGNNKTNSNSSNTNSFNNSTNTTNPSTATQSFSHQCNHSNSNMSHNTNSNNSANTTIVSCTATTYPLYSYNPLTTTIISNSSNSVSNPSQTNINNNNNTTTNNNNTNYGNSNNSNVNNNSSNGLTLKNLMHVNTNTPPIYDPRYLYLIDCRISKKSFRKHRIYTAIHYSDLLNDTVYMSPPVENFTLIVLYDEKGRILTSSSSSSATNQTASEATVKNDSRLSHQTFNYDETEDDFCVSTGDEPEETDSSVVKTNEIIAAVRAKLNCNSTQTIFIVTGGYEEFYSKFPFMCSNIDIRSTADRNKYLTIYPNCVIENQIYIGSGIQAKNWKIIRDLNITHIINCSIEHECVFQDELTYLHVKLEDNHLENIYKFLTKTLRFIEEAFDKYYEEVYKSENSTDFSIDSGINSATSSKSSNLNSGIKMVNSNNRIKPPVFLIHCNLGISRSSSILIAYLMSKYRLCLYSAFKYVKDKRLQIAPNYSFLKQLKTFEDTVF